MPLELATLTPAQDRLVSRAHELIAVSVPWLSRINTAFPVFSAAGDSSNYTDAHGNIYIDFDAEYLDVEARGESRVVAELTTTITACAWKTLRGHVARSEDFGADDQEHWEQASSAVCCRDAVNTPVTGYSDSRTRYLPRPENMVTVAALASVLPGLSDPESITTEDLYLLLEEDKERRSGGGSGGGSDLPEPTVKPLPQGAVPPDGASEQGDLELDGIRADVAQSISAAQGIGTELPENVTEWAADVQADAHLGLADRFRSVVGSVVDTSVNGSRRTYRRPPRFDDGHFIVPGSAGSIRRMVVGIDVSGSRSDAELTQDFAEVTAAAMSHGFDVSYFSVSTMPHGLRHAAFGEAPVFDRDQAGTDMRMAFTMFDEGDWDIAVLLTDGLTPWPTTPARCREVLVAISQPEGRDVSELVDTTAVELPWATVVALPHSWKH